MVPTKVLHAVAGRLHQPRFCSFPEYSTDYDVTQHVVGADAHIGPFVRIHRTSSFAATPHLCLRRLVLTNSTFLAPPQAAGLVRSVARPLQIANASLVCNLVPSVLPEKVCKKRRWIRIGLYRGSTEKARKRTLRPTHETFSTKLYYSAACVETALPSEAVAT